MRRYFWLFIFLLVLDQAAKNLIDWLVPTGTLIRVGGTVQFLAGNLHSTKRLLNPIDPAMMVFICILFAVALDLACAIFEALTKQYKEGTQLNQHLVRWYPVAALCFLFEGMTQGIDYALHGYVIDYFGFAITEPFYYAQLAHIGDHIWELGGAIVLVSTILTLIECVKVWSSQVGAWTLRRVKGLTALAGILVGIVVILNVSYFDFRLLGACAGNKYDVLLAAVQTGSAPTTTYSLHCIDNDGLKVWSQVYP